MMWRLNSIVTACFDAVFGFMESWPGWLSISLLGAVSGVLAMVAYKYTSNQGAIGRVRDDMKASLLAIKLFKDELPVTFRSQARLFWGAVRLFVHSLVPLAVMMVPMVLLICQMALRYEWRPLHAGESANVRVVLKPGTQRRLESVTLIPPDTITVEEGPSRMYRRARRDRPERNEILWRVRAVKDGRTPIKIRIGDAMVEKEITVGDRPYVGVSPVRAGVGFLDQLLYPVEEPAAAGDLIQSIHIEDYPPGKSPVFGWNVHWIITYFVVSMIAALAVKPFLKVRI